MQNISKLPKSQKGFSLVLQRCHVNLIKNSFFYYQIIISCFVFNKQLKKVVSSSICNYFIILNLEEFTNMRKKTNINLRSNAKDGE